MKKILIVDDATFMQKATSIMLSPKYETICASSGEEALELYEKHKPDMVLSDLLMPGMTGLELYAKLQETYHEQIPIMFMTADENEENESLGLAAGAMDYIRKPFKQELLLRRVDNIMRHVDRIAGLKMVAETDHMTGLLNKIGAQKTLGELCLHASGTLMMVDLDSFKLVNDLHGHGMGDRVLIRFAEILRSVIRASDVAGRMGGDEFILFCKDVKEEEVIREKTRQINESVAATAREFMGEDCNIPLGASIGAVCVPEEGTELHELLQKADKALYRVKQNGKHDCAFYRSESRSAEPETDRGSLNTVENLRTILGERNRQKGAYELGSESFQTVYRFVVRSVENYHRCAVLALFTLNVPESLGDQEEITDRFGEVLGSSLRRSDVYSRSGRSQFMVLLPQVEVGSEEPVLHRVLESWASGPYGAATVICETSVIRG